MGHPDKSGPSANDPVAYLGFPYSPSQTSHSANSAVLTPCPKVKALAKWPQVSEPTSTKLLGSPGFPACLSACHWRFSVFGNHVFAPSSIRMPSQP